MKSLEKIRISFLYLFLFSLSIENWSPFGEKQDLFRPSLVVAIFYVALSIIYQPTDCLKVRNLKIFLYPALSLWSLLAINSLYYYLSVADSIFSFNYTLLSCIIAFWIFCNDLTKYKFLTKHVLLIFLLNGIFLSILFYFRIGIDIGYMDRESLLGNNPNMIGLAAVLSLLIACFILIENTFNYGKNRYILLISFPFLLQAISNTGSKGALLTMGISIILYLLLIKKGTKIKIPIIILGLFTFVIAYQFILQNEVMATRWSAFIEEQDTTKRTEFWFIAIDIFIDNPIFGVGENGLIDLGRKVTGRPSFDPHNVYIYILAAGGIVGFGLISFLLVKLLDQSYKNVQFWNSHITLVFFIIMLLYWFKAGGGINSKLVWIYFGLIAYTVNYTKIDNNEEDKDCNP